MKFLLHETRVQNATDPNQSKRLKAYVILKSNEVDAGPRKSVEKISEHISVQ